MQAGNEDKGLEKQIGRLLRALKLTLATSESATGGRVADRITNVSGSSDYFLAGVIAYSNEAKMQLLAVKHDTLAYYGAVSNKTAREMAEGVRKLFNASVGVSTTGIAGPTGATPTKPVGLVYVAVSSPRGTRCERHVFTASREENKEAFTNAALKLLYNELKKLTQ